MKNLLLVLSFLITFTSRAVEYRPCEITYEDGRTEIVEVQFPFANDNPNLRIKRDDKRTNIDKDLIKFFTLTLNEGESEYLFLGGRQFSKRGKKRAKVFTLVEEVDETGIVIGNLGLSYDVSKDKRSGKDIIIFTYIQAHRTYSFSRINEETLYPIIDYRFGPGLKLYYRKTTQKYQETLFPDCSDVSKQIDYDNIKEKGAKTIIEAYKKCLNK